MQIMTEKTELTRGNSFEDQQQLFFSFLFLASLRVFLVKGWSPALMPIP